jgi:hypothetical protein
VRILYLDSRRGLNAIAALAAMIDAGADAEEIGRRLRSLPGGCALRRSDTVVGGLRACRIVLDAPEVPHSGRLEDVEHLIERSRLSPRVRELVASIYRRLAIAEARVHGSTPETATFHEIGAARSVVATIGSAVALELLEPVQVVASPLPAGGGTVATHHGLLPVPAPATAELLRGLPVEGTDQTGELVTPTGVALVSEIASSFGPMPSMVVESVGYGIDEQRSPALVTRVIAGRRTSWS